MSKIIVYEFISLDGRFEGPVGREMDFVQAGFCDAIEQDIGRQYSEVSALIMGRVTFDSLARYWPTDAARDEMLQSQMNAITKLVASSRSDVTKWPGSRHLGETPFAELEERRAASDGDMMVIGSGQLVRELVRRELVDEFRFLVFPVVLGAGTPLFPDGTLPTNLCLIDCRSFETGVLAIDYAVQP